MSHRLSAVVVPILAGLALAGSAGAQVYNPTENPRSGSAPSGTTDTNGFHIGFGLNGSAIQLDESSSDTETGGGLHLRLGYGLNPNITLFLGAAGASMNEGEYSLGQADLGVRAYFPGSSAWVPFIEGAFTGRALTIESGRSELDVTGSAWTAGAGIDFYVSPAVSLGLALEYTFGDFTEASMDGRTIDLGSDAFGAQTTRFNLGLTWWP